MNKRILKIYIKNLIHTELSTNTEFVMYQGGWKLASTILPSETKKRRVEYEPPRQIQSNRHTDVKRKHPLGQVRRCTIVVIDKIIYSLGVIRKS